MGYCDKQAVLLNDCVKILSRRASAANPLSAAIVDSGMVGCQGVSKVWALATTSLRIFLPAGGPLEISWRMFSSVLPKQRRCNRKARSCRAKWRRRWRGSRCACAQPCVPSVSAKSSGASRSLRLRPVRLSAAWSSRFSEEEPRRRNFAGSRPSYHPLTIRAASGNRWASSTTNIGGLPSARRASAGGRAAAARKRAFPLPHRS